MGLEEVVHIILILKVSEIILKRLKKMRLFKRENTKKKTSKDWLFL